MSGARAISAVGNSLRTWGAIIVLAIASSGCAGGLAQLANASRVTESAQKIATLLGGCTKDVGFSATGLFRYPNLKPGPISRDIDLLEEESYHTYNLTNLDRAHRDLGLGTKGRSTFWGQTVLRDGSTGYALFEDDVLIVKPESIVISLVNTARQLEDRASYAAADGIISGSEAAWLAQLQNDFDFLLQMAHAAAMECGVIHPRTINPGDWRKTWWDLSS